MEGQVHIQTKSDIQRCWKVRPASVDTDHMMRRAGEVDYVNQAHLRLQAFTNRNRATNRFLVLLARRLCFLYCCLKPTFCSCSSRLAARQRFCLQCTLPLGSFHRFTRGFRGQVSLCCKLRARTSPAPLSVSCVVLRSLHCPEEIGSQHS